VLAGRKTGGSVTSAITLNGFDKDQKSFARVAGYVEQVDIHSPVVTVREAVDFSATIRLQETDWSPERREVFVDGILEILYYTVLYCRG
jgi:ABC-type multidrug transport system ATPase subunit